MNNIPKELLDKWQREAKVESKIYISTPYADKGLYSLKPLQLMANYEDGYMQGCKSTYLSMQTEIDIKDKEIKKYIDLLDNIQERLRNIKGILKS